MNYNGSCMIMARLASKIQIGLPNKLKGGRVEKLADYVKNIIDDYKTVAVETWQDMKARPIKSSIYISLLTGVGVLMKTNPGEVEFYSRLTESVTDLMLVGELNRNPGSQSVIGQFSKYASDGHMRCFNLGVCSLMCKRTHGPELGLYEAKCKYVKPHWTEFHKTIIDIGVFGRWIYLEEGMKEYDMNPEEWLQDGLPNKEFRFYKDRSLVSWDMKMK